MASREDFNFAGNTCAAGEKRKALVVDICTLFNVRMFVASPDWDNMDDDTLRLMISDIIEVQSDK